VGPGNYDPSLAPTRPNARGSDFSRSKSARTSITRAVPQVKEINDNNNQMFLFLFVKKKFWSASPLAKMIFHNNQMITVDK
jgi:hypothetical protein